MASFTHEPHSGGTIFSLSSAPGRAGVAVFRLSGPKAGEILRKISSRALPRPRYASLAALRTLSGEVIDEGLTLWMPAPASFTGEDCAELQVHGSLAVIEAMAAALLEYGARQSEAGEFTRRAFENGRMELTEAEGLADLIDAETQAQRIQAIRQMQGGLKEIYEDWRERILDALAQIEGEIDFPDEGDIPQGLSHKAHAPLTALARDMNAALETAERGERIRAGLDIAIIGPPNAGKSSFINRLAGRDAVIVTDQAGTTRDIVDINLVIAGLPVRLSDTAGLRESADVIESEGIRRARARAKDADIRLVIHDGAQTAQIDSTLPEGSALLQDGDYLLHNKSDLAAPKTLPLPVQAKQLGVSALTGEGFDAFLSQLEADVTARYSPARVAGLTRVRHRDCVMRAQNAVERAASSLGIAPELAGDDLRAALLALRELAGQTDIEAVFDRIFSRFCVGK